MPLFWGAEYEADFWNCDCIPLCCYCCIYFFVIWYICRGLVLCASDIVLIYSHILPELYFCLLGVMKKCLITWPWCLITCRMNCNHVTITAWSCDSWCLIMWPHGAWSCDLMVPGHVTPGWPWMAFHCALLELCMHLFVIIQLFITYHTLCLYIYIYIPFVLTLAPCAYIFWTIYMFTLYMYSIPQTPGIGQLLLNLQCFTWYTYLAFSKKIWK